MVIRRETRDALFSAGDNAGDGAVGGDGGEEGQGRGQEGGFDVRHVEF